MFSFSQLNEAQILVFALILLRMLSFVVSSAIFGSQTLTVHLKVLLGIVFTIAVYQPIATNETLVRINDLQDNLILLSAREVVLGLILGFVTRLFFFAVSMAGEIVSVAVGLGQAQVFNPTIGSMGNAMEQFYSVLATLVFLSMDGHHMMIKGAIDSFTTSPVAQLTFQYASFAELVLKMQSFFIIGIKMAAPVLISMIIIQLGMALLSRVVPQINVMVTSSAVTLLAGYVILFVSLPLLIMKMTGLMDFSMNEFFKFLRTI